jgi:hypothetical protein
MYGNVITNKQLRTLMESNCLSIDPFDDKLLKAAAYTLSPGRILKRGEDGEWDVAHTFNDRRKSYTLKANEYVVVEPKQNISIRTAGIIGNFITASTNVENGLLVVAGQIDSLYGLKGEALRFGLKNLLGTSNEITISTRLVHVQLIDMRGSATDPVQLNRSERSTWDDRRRDANWQEQNIPNYGVATE